MPKVAIIGSGITGLLVAHGLQKNGFDVEVFERESALDVRFRDWTILIHWAMPILSALLPEDVLSKLPNAICNPQLEFTPEVESMSFVNGVTGDVLFTNPMPGSRRITRQKMRRVLAQGLKIHWGKTLGQLEPGDGTVTITFQDGDEVMADYVLGADGVSSQVRRLLLGPEAASSIPSGLMFATGIVKYGDAEKVKVVTDQHPVAIAWLGGGTSGGIGVMDTGNTPDDVSTWTTFWAKIWPESGTSLEGQQAIDHVKAGLGNISEPYKSLIEWTPDGTPCFLNQLKYWIPVPFPNYGGRVTLAGDALHPMLPFRGQGLQHSIEDASKYVNALLKIRDSVDKTVIQETMAAYDAEAVSRGATAVNQSLQEGKFAMDENTISKMLMARKGHGKTTD